MSTPRQPRRSALADSRASQPRQAPSAPTQEEVTITIPASVLEDHRRVRMTYYEYKDEADRTRGAFVYTAANYGELSFSEFVGKAVRKEVRRREREHNDGEQFPPVSAGDVRRGRGFQR